ncbi:hypothetical protein GDO81_021153 [Engystomops pustulosus]|uniref:Uncharacterized protein n=1 Tax=Engystomops pustulosus TaxID=76066 RepID=A0AAV6ZGD7_ENGPU|nr:hypothetical protein GDO81_021153 [Engystomops pustulosus]
MTPERRGICALPWNDCTRPDEDETPGVSTPGTGNPSPLQPGGEHRTTPQAARISSRSRAAKRIQNVKNSGKGTNRWNCSANHATSSNARKLQCHPPASSEREKLQERQIQQHHKY